MAEKLEDLNLPQASVLKIIKEAIPDQVNVGKDVKAALSKSASMFILYITSQATQLAQQQNRKTLGAQDIFSALQEAEFDDFIEPLKESLQGFKNLKVKTDDKSKKDDAADEEVDDAEEEDLESEKDEV